MSVLAFNRFPVVPVLPVDRQALLDGLLSSGFPIARARSQVDGLADDDGALQMLARHRIHSAGATENALARALASFETDAADSDYQRGYYAALCELRAATGAVA